MQNFTPALIFRRTPFRAGVAQALGNVKQGRPDDPLPRTGSIRPVAIPCRRTETSKKPWPMSNPWLANCLSCRHETICRGSIRRRCGSMK